MPVEVVGWGPDVSAAIDRAENMAQLALFSAVMIGAIALFTLAWIAVAQLRR